MARRTRISIKGDGPSVIVEQRPRNNQSLRYALRHLTTPRTTRQAVRLVQEELAIAGHSFRILVDCGRGTMGQQRWLRTLNIEHHQVLAGTSASMAPGFETAETLETTKAQPDYWAKSKTAVHSDNAA